MNGFQLLRDVSNAFDNYSRRVTAELLVEEKAESFDKTVAEKIRDIQLFTSKLRLLEGKTLAETNDVRNKVTSEETIIKEYGDTATWKIIEQLLVKRLTQTQTLQKLLTTIDHNLDPEVQEQKTQIIEQAIEYSYKERKLRYLEDILKQKEKELLEAQIRWDNVVGKLKEFKMSQRSEEKMDESVKNKLVSLTEKMEIMRWLISKFVTRPDSNYNWMSDPHGRLRALALARQRDDTSFCD